MEKEPAGKTERKGSWSHQSKGRWFGKEGSGHCHIKWCWEVKKDEDREVSRGSDNKSLWVAVPGARGSLREVGAKSTAELGGEQMGSLLGKDRGVNTSVPPRSLTKIIIKFFMVIFFRHKPQGQKKNEVAAKKIFLNRKACPRKQWEVKKQSNLYYRISKGTEICGIFYLWR